MAANQITLFDLPSQGRCATWSLNPWKTRMNLNFKGVDYKTEWLEYPDIKPRLEKHVTLPEGQTTYTIPTLEELYPEPKLAGIETPAFDRLTKDLLPGIMGDLRPVYFSRLPERVLNQASYEYWQTTRAEALGLGKRPDELTDADRDAAWAKLAESGKLKQVSALLSAQAANGPYFEGKEIGFVDFAWTGFLVFWKRIGGAEWEKILELTGDKDLHLKYLQKMEPHIKRDAF
ncbi:hypothetical protein PG997_011895 [Apiospora hydei]|uniref:Glutathione S-transferase UstS-like C-terminal domain-containing protein n=1 Tax=Apiospora hydei TaxID=1337664 RepID=A0ABR1V571_9PEZI